MCFNFVDKCTSTYGFVSKENDLVSKKFICWGFCCSCCCLCILARLNLKRKHFCSCQFCCQSSIKLLVIGNNNARFIFRVLNFCVNFFVNIFFFLIKENTSLTNKNRFNIKIFFPYYYKFL